MLTDPRDFLDRYQTWRRAFEVGFWVFFFCLNAAFNTITSIFDVERVNLSFARWEPAVWEWTSNLVLLALVPAVIAFELRVGCVHHYGALHNNRRAARLD